jgi:hypothetical protein
MSPLIVIIGIVLGVVFGALIIAFNRRYRDVFSVLMVLGVVVLAVAVTAYRVHQFQQQQIAEQENARATTASQSAEAGATMPPPARSSVVIRPLSPLMQGPAGGAAPEATRNPYIGGANGAGSP